MTLFAVRFVTQSLIFKMGIKESLNCKKKKRERYENDNTQEAHSYIFCFLLN